MESELEQRIRERAHRIWEEEGRPHGQQAAHWERARREIAEQQMTGAPEAEAPGRTAAKPGAKKRGSRLASSDGPRPPQD
jgi:hypothetical protein